ncbi:hypothetical protein SAMN05444273_11230 [Litoreibacter ascidiaceicola]|uniref:Lipoprotein n=1 Tax=Litoreibacter ascidiaceicola TaxID=1486859 RepID=A0A1M5EFE8_9RHOB|nr:DUF6778 family protein [Litoreibacter ascidiaceicola]SHF77864.1 hypothetical protein SAMN05444273_11230 [Litoreibacter ascidiaceicola]
MKFMKLIAGLAVAVGLSACASSGPISETATRNAPDVAPVVGAELTARSADWRLADVRVNVSGDLKVSEANRYYPIADIVWREDPYGDRRAQVAKILDDGLTSGLTHLKGDRPVFFDINLSRFHSLTEKTRVSIGGVHNIIYTLTVVDAATGVALHGPIEMEIALKAFGGDQAFEAERRGQTQKVRIQTHLASLMRQAFNGGQEMRVVARAAVAPQDVYTGVTQ